jgi:tetratricopeptide (TPR) repeat protein
MLHGSPRRVVSSFLFSVLLIASSLAQSSPPKALREPLQSAFDRKDYDAVTKIGIELLAAEPNDSLALHHVGYAYHVRGRYDEALEYHRRGAALVGDRYAGTAAYNAACAHALKGEAGAAFEWLEKALGLGFRDAKQIRIDPDLASLRTDPRFEAVVAKLSDDGDEPASVFVASQKMERAGTRVALFQEDGGLGQVSIEYGPVAWKDEFGSALESGQLDGRRWRLGKDYWTNLSADVPFALGDIAFVPGDYYLMLEKAGDRYTLVVQPVAEIRATKQDPYWAHEITGGTAVAMQHTTAEPSAAILDLTLATTSNESKTGSFTIRFGPHVLSTKFEMRE